jgi:hypothetical protein
MHSYRLDRFINVTVLVFVLQNGDEIYA